MQQSRTRQPRNQYREQPHGSDVAGALAEDKRAPGLGKPSVRKRWEVRDDGYVVPGVPKRGCERSDPRRTGSRFGWVEVRDQHDVHV